MSTNWYNCIGGWAGVQFSFQNNSPYPKKHYSNSYSITGEETITIDCQSDELEEYIYPVITVTEPKETAIVKIQSETDNGKTMTIRAYDRMPMTFDCRYCIPSDAAGIISYSDLGWKDVGDIYWPRLVPGKNTLHVTGDAEITISYDVVYKKVGGWV